MWGTIWTECGYVETSLCVAILSFIAFFLSRSIQIFINSFIGHAKLLKISYYILLTTCFVLIDFEYVYF